MSDINTNDSSQNTAEKSEKDGLTKVNDNRKIYREEIPFLNTLRDTPETKERIRKLSEGTIAPIDFNSKDLLDTYVLSPEDTKKLYATSLPLDPTPWESPEGGRAPVKCNCGCEQESKPEAGYSQDVTLYPEAYNPPKYLDAMDEFDLP